MLVVALVCPRAEGGVDDSPVVKITGKDGRIGIVVKKPGKPVTTVPHESPVDDGVTCTLWAEGAIPGPRGPGEWEENGVTYHTGILVCSDGSQQTGTFCVRNCPEGAGIVAVPTFAEARALLAYPTPIPRLSPKLEHARTGTAGGYIVGIPMYIALQADQWRPIAASASAGGVTVSVVATPIRLEVDVGGEHVTCNGPGEIVTGANWRYTTSTCKHLFIDRGAANLSMRIVYAHTYATTQGNPPPLPVGEIGVSATTTETLPVVEYQTIVEVIR